jgi:hypothetical protein
MRLKNLNFCQFQRDAEDLLARGTGVQAKPYPDSFLRAYPEFLRYFEVIKKQGDIQRHHLVIASHFVYGWMPTFVYLDLSRETDLLQCLNKALQGRRLRREELLLLKRSVSNSMSGVSKLLHFINPDEYAFWDRRIFRHLSGQRGQLGVDKPELYLEYLAGLKGIIAHAEYPSLHDGIEAYYNSTFYPMRAVEIVMYETARQQAWAPQYQSSLM